eukprot:c18327_g1_i3 orf=600-2111(+)
MAGVGGDKGRKLRVRGVAAASAVPMTRSTAAAAASIKATVSRQVEAPRRTTTTTSKVALKRAAALDDNIRTSVTAPLQQPKKRAALANLTNCSNLPSTRSIMASLKPPVKPKAQAAAIRSREVEAIKDNLEPTLGKKADTNIPLRAQNDENALLGRETGPLDVFKSTARVIPCVATQTSASSQQITCLLKDLKPKTRQGYCFDEDVEGEGWSCKNYTNIDDNIKDPQMCSSYAPDIYFYLQNAELRRRPARNFMEAVQRDINASMRGILVDWLVEVAEEYKLVPDTLYLTIAYIDRFLSGNVVNRQQLQLLGVSCMLIASKYEEICAPQVDEFCYITDNTYGREEVLKMEKTVLNHLQFELTVPTTKTFLRRFIRAAQAGQKAATLQLEYLGNYLAELTLMEYGFLQYLPSMIAGSAVFLARVTLNPTTRPWNSTLQHYSGYKPSELVECVKAIHDLQCNKRNCTLPAVREKYKQPKFKSVACFVPPAIIPLKYFEDLDDTVL